MTSRVLVTDGEQRSALAVVRSLGRAGHHPLVVATARRSLAGTSRYAEGYAAAPDPLREPAGFVEEVRRLVPRWGVDFILPMTEASMLALLPARESLGASLPCATAESFRRVSDKGLLLRTAAEVGIAVPEQRTLEGPDPAAWAALAGLGFPLVLKPSRSVAGEGAGRMKLAVQYASQPADLETLRLGLPPQAYPVLAQRRITGPGIGIFLLLWDGEVRAVFSHRRIREKPPSGGVSVYRESIPAEASLVSRSRALLDRFDWQGVAMIEYKVDQGTGIPYLMEINGRFWGSLQLAVDAGVDFPALLIALARGERPAPVTAYRRGVRSRWWLGDLDQLLTRLRRSAAELALPPGTPGRLGAIGDFLVLWRPGDRNEICRWNDPAPALFEAVQWIRGR